MPTSLPWGFVSQPRRVPISAAVGPQQTGITNGPGAAGGTLVFVGAQGGSVQPFFLAVQQGAQVNGGITDASYEFDLSIQIPNFDQQVFVAACFLRVGSSGPHYFGLSVMEFTLNSQLIATLPVFFAHNSIGEDPFPGATAGFLTQAYQEGMGPQITQLPPTDPCPPVLFSLDPTPGTGGVRKYQAAMPFAVGFTYDKVRLRRVMVATAGTSLDCRAGLCAFSI